MHFWGYANCKDEKSAFMNEFPKYEDQTEEELGMYNEFMRLNAEVLEKELFKGEPWLINEKEALQGKEVMMKLNKLK